MRTGETLQTNGTLPDPTGTHGGGPHDVPPGEGSTGRGRRWPLVLAVVVVAVLAAVLGVWALAGDGESDQGATVTEPEAGTDATEGPVTTGTPATTDAATPPLTTAPAPTTGAPVLEDGRHPVYLTVLDVDARTVEFDLIQWLTGDAARDAWTAANPDMPGYPPNDYFVVNDNPRLRVLPVAGDVPVTVLDHGWDPMEITFGELPGFVADDLFPEDGFLWHNPFWLTVDDGTVTAIEEQYTP